VGNDDRRDALRRAQKRYQSKLRTYILRFRLDEDSEVIERLDHEGNKTGYVRELIERDICEGK